MYYINYAYLINVTAFLTHPRLRFSPILTDVAGFGEYHTQYRQRAKYRQTEKVGLLADFVPKFVIPRNSESPQGKERFGVPRNDKLRKLPSEPQILSLLIYNKFCQEPKVAHHTRRTHP